MKVLVIPDVHLKPWIFRRASDLMNTGIAENAVCLMDIADDWGKEYGLELYRDTYDEAIRFATEYPESRWCYGNHDISYVWQMKETGYSHIAPKLVCEKLQELKVALPNPEQLAFVHKIDDCIFSHGGISAAYVRKFLSDPGSFEDADKVIAKINKFGCRKLWVPDEPSSPIWFRPQYYCTREEMYLPDQYLQIVGHTPVEEIQQTFDCLLSCDTFSTYRNGEPIGTQEFLLLDTVSHEWKGVK